MKTLFADDAGYCIRRCEGAPSRRTSESLESAHTIEICLNEQGEGKVAHGRHTLKLKEESLGIYEYIKGSVTTQRQEGTDHRFTTISLDKTYLQDQLAPSQFLLKPEIRKAIFTPPSKQSLQLSRNLHSRDTQWLSSTESLEHIPLAGRNLWMQSKVMEFVALNFFKTEGSKEELFCKKNQTNGFRKSHSGEAFHRRVLL